MINKQTLHHGWSEKSVGELFKLDSGIAPVKFRPGDFSGPILVYGANGPIGSCDEPNYGPGYLVGRVGAAGAITKIEVPVWASDNTLTATPKAEICSESFAGHYLRFLNPAKLATMTAQPLITQSNLSKLRARVPEDIGEQARIAVVLDILDETIAKAEAVIAKLRQVRAGLLHDLLTRGLDENDDLRDPMVYPEHFKNLGSLRVPKAWRVFALEQVATLQRGFDLPIQDRREGKIPVYGSNGIDGRHDIGKVKGPGVITGRSGSIGFVYYADSDFWPLNTTLYVRDFHGNQPKFVWLLLESLRLGRFSAATGVPSLNRNFVHPTQVAVPPPEEQERIVFVIENQNSLINSNESYLRKLKALKEGLVSDLLTGRVRVPEGII